MRKEGWLYVLLGFTFFLYIGVEYYSPKPLDWTVTFHAKDKNPYGGYILNERLQDFFDESEKSNLSLYELKDSTAQLLILSEYFELDELDMKVLLNKVAEGQSAIIASHHFSKQLMDTLEISSDILPFKQISADTLKLRMKNQFVDYESKFFRSSFGAIDTTWQIHASLSDPVLISKPWGKGKLILCTMPLLFTNYGIVSNEHFAEYTLNLLSTDKIHLTQFYQMGKVQNSSPFRYILTQESLRWALYLSIFLILIFLIVGSQRKQKSIPVIPPLENTTVSFIKTMGALFYRERNFKLAAEKLIISFFSDLQKRHFLGPDFSETYYAFIASKTATDRSLVIKIFERLQNIQQIKVIDESALKQLYKDLNTFNFK